MSGPVFAFPRPLPTGAFPPEECVRIIEQHAGMTLRDYFAAKAMQAEMITSWSDATPQAAEDFAEAATRAGRSVEDHLAFNAYLIADAMLKARSA